MTITATTTKTTVTKRVPMTSLRKTSLAAGVFYLVTFVSIPTFSLYHAVHNANYIVGSGPDKGVLLGGFLEIIVGLAGIGTAVALYPVVKRQHEAAALGFVASRVLEAGVIFIGVATIVSIATLRRDGTAGTDSASLVAAGRSLVATHDWTFLGQPLMSGINALLLGSLMYRSRLVPRIIPLLGLIGAPFLLASTAATFFGVYDQVSVWSGIATAPVALWEFSLGVYLVVKGFKPCGITAEITAEMSTASGVQR